MRSAVGSLQEQNTPSKLGNSWMAELSHTVDSKPSFIVHNGGVLGTTLKIAGQRLLCEFTAKS